VTGTMTWAAMDVHARSTYAASLDVVTGELSRQRFDTGAVEPVVGWLVGLPGPVRACYEAGPTGFGLYRAAVAAGIDCQVIAPSKTPRPSGDRNKSDRRDTDLLLRQLMAGALTAVAVPSATFEAARDLARAREQVRLDLMRCRHRLSQLLLRHGRVYPESSTWTAAHRRWLSAQQFDETASELVFGDLIASVDGLTARKSAMSVVGLAGMTRFSTPHSMSDGSCSSAAWPRRWPETCCRSRSTPSSTGPSTRAA